MERYMQGPFEGLSGFNDGSLLDAFWFFSNATALDNRCESASLNLGLVMLKMNKISGAIDIFHQFSSPRSKILEGIALEMLFKFHDSTELIKSVTSTNPLLHAEYFGLILIGTEKNSMRKLNQDLEMKAVVDQLLWKEFSSISVSNYAQLLPGATDHFVKSKWIILRKIIPPFMLSSIQECFRNLISNKVLVLGDRQAKRYTAYNSRCAAFIHFSLTDLVRKVIAHNSKPSYTYFGGYVGGSELQPHTDRPQCEFTMSLTIENVPYNTTWLLSLGNRAKFEKNDKWGGANPEQMPPEDEIVDADLYAGDCLLFMGRHLIHFRRGSLSEGRAVNQVFLHYVQENFDKSLG
eukprot:TRINITY_DN5296_c0_g1_i2.p1 TRINITY_DN5296_c0_g1~~TRINITY_DN5296_c0_g1_i2.p1  ORF type:complete len:349 (-),score=48.00 TRINITY_DN5296_c0_g1_i2:62-1108(-)